MLAESLFAFSAAHCVGLCAFLVPANLLATLVTLVLAALGRPGVGTAATVAALLAATMALHVWAWFIVGVVMGPSFILLALAALCLGLNLWAVSRWHYRLAREKPDDSAFALQPPDASVRQNLSVVRPYQSENSVVKSVDARLRQSSS